MALPAVAFAMATVPAAAQQALQLTPRVQATVTASDNPGLVAKDAARADVVADLFGNLGLRLRGARLSVDGDLGAHALAYARNSSANKLLPDGRLAVKSTLLERWLYLDAGFSAAQTAADPFGVAVDNGSSANRITSVQYQVAPRLQHDFSPTLSGLAQVQRAWTRRRGDATIVSGDATNDEDIVRLEAKPVPLGGAIEATHLDTRYQGAAQSALRVDAIRASVSLTPATDWSVAGTVGREHTRYAVVDRQDDVYGLTLKYQPTERTQLAATIERRFFGTGFDLDARHRSPFFSFVLHVVRRPNALPSSQTLAGGASTTALLDAMLTTREPDPVLRAAKVRNLIAELNLPATLASGIEVYVDSARLEQGADVTAAFQGRLTTVTLNVSMRKLEALPTSDPLAPALDTQSSRQSSTELVVSRRLTSTLTANGDVRFSRITGLGARAGEQTDNLSAGASLARQLSPQTTISVAARRRLVDSKLAAVPSAAESSVAVALGHRF